MRREPIGSYFFFGTCMRYLQDCDTSSWVNKPGYVLHNINTFLDILGKLGLQVTQRACVDLVVFRQELSKKTDENATLSAEEASKLTDIMNDIRKTLEAELAGFHAFLVTPKILDTEKLLNNVSSLLRPNLFSALPNIAQHDLNEAGKCIAFERPTAAAFHLLRGTESVLRNFYCVLVRQKRIPTPLMWANMVIDLRNRPKTKMHVTLYNNLDNIRSSYRNPTQHPEKIYDINEAQDLWPLCIEAINRMTIILQEYKHKPRAHSTELLAVLTSKFRNIEELPKHAKIVVSQSSESLTRLETALRAYGKSAVPVLIPKSEQFLALKLGVVDAVLLSDHPSNQLKDSIESNEICLLSWSKSSLDIVTKMFPSAIGQSALRPNTYKGQSKKLEGYAPY